MNDPTTLLGRSESRLVGDNALWLIRSIYLLSQSGRCLLQLFKSSDELARSIDSKKKRVQAIEGEVKSSVEQLNAVRRGQPNLLFHLICMEGKHHKAETDLCDDLISQTLKAFEGFPSDEIVYWMEDATSKMDGGRHTDKQLS